MPSVLIHFYIMNGKSSKQHSSTTITVYSRSVHGSHLAHPVVCQLDVSLVIQENIVQFQISVEDSLFMQEIQSDTNFSSIESEKKGFIQTCFSFFREFPAHRLRDLVCPNVQLGSDLEPRRNHPETNIYGRM